jgi:hypothetical protein
LGQAEIAECSVCAQPTREGRAHQSVSFAISIFTLTVLTLFSLRLQESLSTLDEKYIGEQIEMYGCNMRTLREILTSGPEGVQQAISRMISGLSISDIRYMLRNNADAAGDPSHNLITSHCLDQPQPKSGGRYLVTDTLSSVITSTVVWNKLFHARGKAVYIEFTHLFEHFSRIPQAAAAAGRLWEGWAHGRISEGGTFTLTPIFADKEQNQDDVRISLSPREMSLFTAKDLPSATQTPTKYWIPFSDNNPTFDSFFYHKGIGIGLQMTVAANHSLNAQGLDMLYRRLNARKSGSTLRHWFVFVICEGYKFRCQAPSAGQLKKFCFFTMKLKPPKGKHLSLPLAHASVADGGFVGANPNV